jgi:hypothetical protein
MDVNQANQERKSGLRQKQRERERESPVLLFYPRNAHLVSIARR